MSFTGSAAAFAVPSASDASAFTFFAVALAAFFEGAFAVLAATSLAAAGSQWWSVRKNASPASARSAMSGVVSITSPFAEKASIIGACARLLKPGGRLFLSTLNRTPAAFALAIVGAEYVARVLPKGTHQYRDFIKPSELAKWLRDAGLELEDVSGLMYEPWRNSARIVSRTGINYLASARKPA